METEEGPMQIWHMCALILSLYTSSGHLVLSLQVFFHIFSTASIFTDEKVCKGFGEREVLYLHPFGLGEMVLLLSRMKSSSTVKFC